MALVLGLVGIVQGYPLDGHESTQIHRLEAFDLARSTLLERGTLKPGALLALEKVKPRLLDRPTFEIPEADAGFTAEIKKFLGQDGEHYGVAVLDLSDPQNPRYGAYKPDKIQNPGSVGKILVALAWFQSLADRFPNDIEARKRLLRETTVTANGFIRHDHHVVPFWRPGDQRLKRRPLAEGDQANLWTYLDWMASASSNAAASMLMSHLVLFKHFGEEYPVSEERATAFFADTPKQELGKIYLDAMLTPLERNGFDQERLRQGSFFTREGKNRVPGTNSLATAGELMKFLVKLEKGALVDAWSSQEIKRLLYLTDIRIRYASHPALNDSAVYFKSGSLYSCKEEPGFECKKYHGNVRNYMNSVAIVETEKGGRTLQYLVVVLSNVLRKNSAVEHQTLALRIHRLIESLHPALTPVASPPPEKGLLAEEHWTDE